MTKNGDHKILVFNQQVIKLLKELRSTLVDSSLVTPLDRYKSIENDLIFRSPLGGDQKFDFRKQWIKIVKLAQIPLVDEVYQEKLVFHSLRHTFCTTLHEQKRDLKTIQGMAGHRNMATTLIYTHDSIEIKQDVVDNDFDFMNIVFSKAS